jgi:hypothetical protein
LPSGEELLMKCIDDLEKFKMESKVVNVYQHLQNNLGILWTARRDYEKSLKFFKDAEQIYLSYKQQTGGGLKAMEEYITKPWDEDKLERKRMVEFEKTYTLTLYCRCW